MFSIHEELEARTWWKRFPQNGLFLPSNLAIPGPFICSYIFLLSCYKPMSSTSHPN